MILLRTRTALVRFQLAAGARVALRTLAPVAAGTAAAAVMYGSPMVVVAFFRGLFFSPLPSLGGALVATGIVLAFSLSSAPRLTLGLAGWARHLPASGTAVRQAATAGLTVALLPVLVLMATGGLAALMRHPASTWPRLAALAAVGWAASLAGLPVERGWTRAVAAAAAVALWYGTWPGFLMGAVLLAAAEFSAGAITSRSRHMPRRPPASGVGVLRNTTSARAAAIRLWWSVSRRALGWRLVSSSVPGVLVLVPVVFFLHNNRLSELQQAIGLRLAATVAVVCVMATAADGLVRRRPPWPWIRSLPWSALTRISLDAMLLSAIAAPIFLAALALDPKVVWVTACAVPLLGLRTATAIRQAPGRLSGASGQALLEGAIIAALLALLPWASLALLLAVPFAARYGADVERNREISRWHELHHLAAGDPMSWSGT